MNDLQALIDQARGIAEKAAAANRDLTPAEQRTIDGNLDRVKEIRAAQSRSEEYARFFGQKRDTGPGLTDGTGHLALATKDVASRIVEAKSVPGTATVVSNVVQPGVITEGRAPTSILQVVPSRVVGPSYTWVRQTARDLKAAVVLPGGIKPESDLTIESVQGQLHVVAHISSKCDKYILQDASSLVDFIQSEMAYGLQTEIIRLLLNGSGTNAPRGILQTSGILVQPFATSALVSIRKALTLLENAGYEPGAIVCTPALVEELELLLVASGGIDVRGLPLDPVSRRLFGVPMAIETGLPAKTAIVLGKDSVSLDTDGEVSSTWSDAVADDFQTNSLRLRTEVRVNVAVQRPGAIVKVGTAA